MYYSYMATVEKKQNSIYNYISQFIACCVTPGFEKRGVEICIFLNICHKAGC